MKKFGTSWVLLALAAAASGALYFFSTGLAGLRPLVWIAPLPVLLVSMQYSRRHVMAAAFIAYMLGGLNMVAYLAQLTPIGFVLASVLLPALAFAVIVVAYRDALVHLRHPLSFIAYPVGWTAYEYLLSALYPHGSAGSIAYTQADFLPLIQIASLTGIQGITFVATLVPAGLAAAFLARTRRDAVRILLVVLGVGIGTLTYGWLRLATPPSGETINVGLVAVDSTVTYFNTTDRNKALEVLGIYGRSITDLSKRGAQIVLLPEKFVGVTEEFERDVFSFLSGLARQRRVTIIAGLNRIGSEPHRNLAVLFASDGSIAGEYDKVHPIPGLELGYSIGKKIFFFPYSDISAGIAICKDMDFQSWIRKYGQAGVRVIFVPAWDFSSDAWLHSRMSVLRGVENGFSVIRSANKGLLSVSDDRGRILAGASSSEASVLTLLGQVRPGEGRTFYAFAGAWFSWLNLLFLLVLVIAVSRRLVRRLSNANS